MTKAELVKTVVALDSRQTKLLNEIASLTQQRDDFQQAMVEGAEVQKAVHERHRQEDSAGKMPWEQN